MDGLPTPSRRSPIDCEPQSRVDGIMRIESQRLDEKLILLLEGRLDASWSEYVGSAIESAIRNGEHRIDIDMSGVHYMSSAGINVLLKYRKQLENVHGALVVCNPVDEVRQILRLMKLDKLLLTRSQPDLSNAQDSPSRTLEWDGVGLELFPLTQGNPLQCEWLGYPEEFAAGTLNADRTIAARLDENLFCLGLGAFGERRRTGNSRLFGEALGLAGVAVEQATDGSRVPDFQIAEGEMVPELQFLYGISGRGEYSHLIRFEAGRSERGTVSFSKMIEGVLGAFDCHFGGFALVVEATAVVGASLTRCPTESTDAPSWSVPDIRQWLTFTTEQTDDRSIALIVGVAGRSPKDRSCTFLRPIREGSYVHGHFHAAVFPYRPLAKGFLSIQDTLRNIFKLDTPRSVLHLVADDRPIEGVGQTELMRGACWFGPVSD